MNIAVLVGSIREQSYNRMVVETMREKYSSIAKLEILDITSLPYFNQDEESDPPESVHQFKMQIEAADGVLVATPEYNWSIPGILKNALDWLSRGERVMVGKPTMLIGASTGMVGTIRGQLHLRQIFSSPGLSARLLPPAGNEVIIPFIHQKIDSTGRLKDAETLLFLDSVFRRFLNMISTPHI